MFAARTRALLTPTARLALTIGAALALAAVLAGGVRVLPWLLDPQLPWGVAWVFTKAVAIALGEVVLLASVPIALALGLAIREERGELRLWALLGEAPWLTAARLLPLLLPWLLLLAALAYGNGQSARAPGQVLRELLARGQENCTHSAVAQAHTVPMLEASWLCEPGKPAQLVGRAPLGAIAFRTEALRPSDDGVELTLDRAQLQLPLASVQVARITLRGLPPYVLPAQLEPWQRALLVTGCGLLSAGTLLWLALRRTGHGRPRHPAWSLAIGVSGPLACALTLANAHTLPRAASSVALALSAALPWLLTSVWQHAAEPVRHWVARLAGARSPW